MGKASRRKPTTRLTKKIKNRRPSRTSSRIQMISGRVLGGPSSKRKIQKRPMITSGVGRSESTATLIQRSSPLMKMLHHRSLLLRDRPRPPPILRLRRRPSRTMSQRAGKVFLKTVLQLHLLAAPVPVLRSHLHDHLSGNKTNHLGTTLAEAQASKDFAKARENPRKRERNAHRRMGRRPSSPAANRPTREVILPSSESPELKKNAKGRKSQPGGKNRWSRNPTRTKTNRRWIMLLLQRRDVARKKIHPRPIARPPPRPGVRKPRSLRKCGRRIRSEREVPRHKNTTTTRIRRAVMIVHQHVVERPLPLRKNRLGTTAAVQRNTRRPTQVVHDEGIVPQHGVLVLVPRRNENEDAVLPPPLFPPTGRAANKLQKRGDRPTAREARRIGPGNAGALGRPRPTAGSCTMRCSASVSHPRRGENVNVRRGREIISKIANFF